MYEAPDAELFLVRFEEDFLQGTNGLPDSPVTDIDDPYDED